MKRTNRILPVYAADISGVCSALYELGGMTVMHDASGCNSTYTTHDEPRWYSMDSMVYISALSELEAVMGDDEKLVRDIVDAALNLCPAFICMGGTPIPMMMGTDFKGIARMIENKTGIPTFGIATNGMHSYVRGAGEALRRIEEGASMIRTKGEPGTGDVVQAVRHMRAMNSEIRRVQNLREDELYEAAKQLKVPVHLLRYVHDNGRLPVVNFAAGGVATPADAALMMQLGAEGVFVGSGIFKSGNPEKRASAIVQAVTNYKDAKLLAAISEDLGEAMVGINENEIAILMAERGQ